MEVSKESLHQPEYYRGMYIWVTTQFEGLHCWPEAPDEVAFLRNQHRHIFHVRLEIEVHNDDRDLEFLMVKKWLNGVIEKYIADDGRLSCEQIAKEILEAGRQAYPNRNMLCEVSEDKENGVKIFMNKFGGIL